MKQQCTVKSMARPAVSER